MLGFLSSVPSLQLAPLLAQATPIAPIVILLLCLIAGVGTVLMLPGRREASWRTIGGVVVLVSALIFAALLIRWGATDGGWKDLYFWIFSGISLAGALRVVTHPKPVYSALYFVLTVFATAGLFLLLWAEFMAIALILIYAGAILVTYVFVIMLAAEATTNESGIEKLAEHDAVSREPVVAGAVGFALMGILLFVIFDRANEVPRRGEVNALQMQGQTQQLGEFLFRSHVANLELGGLILTIAMVGAIMIARKRIVGGERTDASPEVVVGPATPVDDSPNSIPVYGTDNPRQKAYPET